MTETAHEEPPPPELRDWFEDATRQAQASQLGMWLFLTSEVLLFAGLFALYVAYRITYSQSFAEASRHNDVLIGTTNTLILITSSFFVAWAVHAVRSDRRRTVVLSLLAAVALGAVFLTLKAFEYSDHFHHGIYPGGYYAFDELPANGAKIFFTLYYFMTALHAFHVIGGMIALAVVAILAARGKVRGDYHTSLENAGLYWHLVDVVWIFLWPMLYLAG